MSCSNGEELFTPTEVCKYLKINRKTLWNWVNKGRIPHYKINNKSLRFTLKDIESLLRYVEVRDER